MSHWAYRTLLYLLPRRRRDAYGEDMAVVFHDVRAAARRDRGVPGVALCWTREVRGLLMSAARLRLRGAGATRASSSTTGRSGPDLPSELRWAWRGVRARRWSAALAVSTLAVALAANTFMFAITDALVFNRVPYDQPHRLVELQEVSPRRTNRFVPPDVVDGWRQQRDVFEGIGAYLRKTTFLVGAQTGLEPLVDVTPGLPQVLGVAPIAGRSLVEADTSRLDRQAVLISEDLALERFGSAAEALGRELRTSSQPLLVVGVMPGTFHFPQASVRIWRAFDPRGPLAFRTNQVQTVARLAPDMTIEQAGRALAERTSSVVGDLRRDVERLAVAQPSFAVSPEAPLYLGLLVAAVCLLLTACANLASLEIASAAQRAKTFAVRIALGAPRGSLVRTVLLEGALMLAAAILLAAGVAWVATTTAAAWLPASVRYASPTTIAFNVRAFAFMAALGSVAWLVAAAPVVALAFRRNLTPIVSHEGRTTAASRASGRLRRWLTVMEVGLAVLLLSTSVLAVRTFQSIAASDKGFDSRNVGEVHVTLPLNVDQTPVIDALVDTLRTVPGVLAVSPDQAPPSFSTPSSDTLVEIADESAPEEAISLALLPVSPSYFDVIDLSPIHGRTFEPGDELETVVMPERLARRYFGDDNPVGRLLRWSPDQPWHRVIGVVPQILTDYETATGATSRYLYLFTPRRPRPAAVETGLDTGSGWGFATVMLRTDSTDRGAAILRAAREAVPLYEVRFGFVDDLYVEMLSPLRVAANVVNVFGTLAFVIAAVGVYGVIAFLVASRSREIGIRMALGARREDIRRLVVGSGLRLVTVGAALGLAGTWALARLAQSASTRVNALDPVSYGVVVALVVAAALIATWSPARRATRVDPAITLRAE